MRLQEREWCFHSYRRRQVLLSRLKDATKMLSAQSNGDGLQWVPFRKRYSFREDQCDQCVVEIELRHISYYFWSKSLLRSEPHERQQEEYNQIMVQPYRGPATQVLRSQQTTEICTRSGQTPKPEMSIPSLRLRGRLITGIGVPHKMIASPDLANAPKTLGPVLGIQDFQMCDRPLCSKLTTKPFSYKRMIRAASRLPCDHGLRLQAV